LRLEESPLLFDEEGKRISGELGLSAFSRPASIISSTLDLPAPQSP